MKKLFIDEKVPRYARERIPVLARGGELLAVAGLGAQENIWPGRTRPVMSCFYPP